MNQNSAGISVGIFISFRPIYIRAKIVLDKNWRKIKQTNTVHLTQFLNPGDIPDI